MLGMQVQDSQNRNNLMKTSLENTRSVERSERYVPEPVTGRATRTTTASRSVEQQAGSTNSVRVAPPASRATEQATGEVTNRCTMQILDPVTLRQPESLHYFSYLGKLNPKLFSSKRCITTRSMLTSRPVILTSTSFVSTNVIDALQRGNQEGQAAQPGEHHPTPEECKELVECCTCVCCVKAMFYHCTKDKDEEGRVAEHPCSCKGPWTECLPRWGILGILSMFMPCLWCYLPCRACEKVPVCYRDWLAERRLRSEQARQAEVSVPPEVSSSIYVETYEPVNLQRQEALRIQDPFGLLSRGRYVDIGTLNSM